MTPSARCARICRWARADFCESKEREKGDEKRQIRLLDSRVDFLAKVIFNMGYSDEWYLVDIRVFSLSAKLNRAFGEKLLTLTTGRCDVKV